MEYGQFHTAVLQRLQAIQSEKDFIKNQDIEAQNNVEDFLVQNPDMSETSFSFDFDVMKEKKSALEIHWSGAAPPDVADTLLKVLARNRELEEALKIKESAIKKLATRNAELEQELKRKETVRLSQLELLALRNVELERVLHQQNLSSTV